MSLLRFYIRKLIFESVDGRKSNFKMIFLAGSPGAGKSTLVDMLGLDEHFTTCNIDLFFEPMMKEEGIDLNMAQTFSNLKDLKNKKENDPEAWTSSDEEELEQLSNIRSREGQLFASAIKNFVQQKRELCEIGSNFIVDGTAATPRKIIEEKEFYESMGYDCAMIKINIPTEVSMERNRQRGTQGKRQLPDFIVRRNAERSNSQENVTAYKNAFGENFFFVPNVGSYEEFQENINEIQTELEAFLRS